MRPSNARYQLPADWPARCRSLQRRLYAWTRRVNPADGKPFPAWLGTEWDQTAYEVARGLAHTAIQCYPDLAPGEPMRY